MKRHINNITKSFIILISFFIGYSLLTLFFTPIITNYDPIYEQSINNFIQITLTVCLIFIFKKDLKEDKSQKINLKKIVVTFLIAFSITTVLNKIIFSITGVSPSNNIDTQNLIKQFPINGIISALFLAPFYEEILFRLNFRKSITNKWNFILLTGILFGSTHILGCSTAAELFYLIPYNILGITLSYIYYDTNSIYASMLIHFLNNLIQVLLIFGGII